MGEMTEKVEISCLHDWIPVRTRKEYYYEMENIDHVIETVESLHCPNCDTYKELGE